MNQLAADILDILTPDKIISLVEKAKTQPAAVTVKHRGFTVTVSVRKEQVGAKR
jgi:hypothetical protein